MCVTQTERSRFDIKVGIRQLQALISHLTHLNPVCSVQVYP